MKQQQRTQTPTQRKKNNAKKKKKLNAKKKKNAQMRYLKDEISQMSKMKKTEGETKSKLTALSLKPLNIKKKKTSHV